MTQLKTKNEKLEYTNDEKKKLVLEINTGDAEKVSEWFKVIEVSKKELSGSDYVGAKEVCRKIIISVLDEKTFTKIVKFCNNNLSCILAIMLDVIEKIASAQYAYADAINARAEVLKKIGK